MDQSNAGSTTVKFGAGPPLSSLGSIDVTRPVGTVRFHVVKAMTLFLLCLRDLDQLNVYFDNTRNLLVGQKDTVPVVRRFGHPFLAWDTTCQFYLRESLTENPCFLTETGLRRLHRRFGHPSIERLHRLLERAGHEVSSHAIEKIRDFCHHCQVHGSSPRRFKFTLHEDANFNHSIIVDIMYIDGRPVSHIIDEATRFNAARWLSDISARTTWDTLRLAWIDTYLGPPDFVTGDAGKNFVSREFSQLASSVGTIAQSVPVEAHWSIGVVERYHAVLRRAYEIIQDETPDLSKDAKLQMAVKAVNDTAGPDRLVPTLLVFGAYPRMVDYDPPAPSVAARAAALKKATVEVRKLHAQRQVQDALNTRNGPSTTLLHRLPLNSNVLVWREGKTGYSGKWTSPYTLLGIDNETCTVRLPSGPTDFRSTVVKSYMIADDTTDTQENNDQATDTNPEREQTPTTSTTNEETPEQRPQRNHRLPARYRDTEAYMQFEASRLKEINGLLENDVFALVNLDDIPPAHEYLTYALRMRLRTQVLTRPLRSHDLLPRHIMTKRKALC